MLSLEVRNFQREVPLFAQLPEAMVSTLDLSGFYLPKGLITVWRFDLEKELRQFVVSYRAEVCNLDTPLDTHLCALVRGANLREDQKELLNQYEARSKRFGVTYVVYQKPVEFIDPYKSAISDLYRKYGKL